MRRAAAAPASAEVSQFLSRVTGLDATHTDAFSALIDGLVTDSIWTKLDALWIGATDTEAHSQINLKSSSFALTKVGSVSFTADQGWTGDASTGFWKTGLIPNTGGGQNFVQDSGSLGAYVRTNRTTDAFKAAMGVKVSFSNVCTSNLYPKHATAKAAGCLNHAGGTVAGTNSTVSTAAGMSIISRTGATAGAIYKNGSSISTFSTASDATLPNTNFAIGAQYEFNDATASAFSDDQIAAAFVGSGLNATEAGNISSRINTYMTAIGTNVY